MQLLRAPRGAGSRDSPIVCERHRLERTTKISQHKQAQRACFFVYHCTTLYFMGKQDKRQQPIGVLDSGIGGLTVAHAIKKLLPGEHMIYFGDTAHLPYGDKSEAAIQAYSVRIADVLLRKGCKVIVIACNSASSAAYELLKEYVRRDTHIINVIDPMVDLVATSYPEKRIGLIGTKRTV